LRVRWLHCVSSRYGGWVIFGCRVYTSCTVHSECESGASCRLFRILQCPNGVAFNLRDELDAARRSAGFAAFMSQPAQSPAKTEAALSSLEGRCLAFSFSAFSRRFLQTRPFCVAAASSFSFLLTLERPIKQRIKQVNPTTTTVSNHTLSIQMGSSADLVQPYSPLMFSIASSMIANLL
jgi:hypothetical protein